MILVLMKTNMGEIVLELNEEKAPVTTANFLSYVKNKHYDGTVFHRVIPGFMIQGGGMTADMKEKKTAKPIENEAKNGLSNAVGTIAMARTNDPHSATSQFFINVENNTFLNQQGAQWGYAVFGKVISGMDVVHAIAKVKTGSHGFYDDVPLDAVVIESVQVVSAAE